MFLARHLASTATRTSSAVPLRQAENTELSEVDPLWYTLILSPAR